MVNRYVALLRGINVGGVRIKMPDLKTAFERAGCSDVKTYLQSGNVVFGHGAPLAEVKTLLEKTLTATFEYEAYVLLYEYSSLAGVIAGYPFDRDETHHAYAVFVDNAAAFDELSAQAAVFDEPIRAGGQLFYWKCVKGQSLETPFSKLLAKAKYKPCTTTRNLNTLELIVAEPSARLE
jgi:uncharacterized protein (DUF1697 family)